MPSETLDRITAEPAALHPGELDRTIDAAKTALQRKRAPDGHWVFELEADATIPAEYVLLEHYLDRIDPELQDAIGIYLRGPPGRSRRLAAVP